MKSYLVAILHWKQGLLCDKKSFDAGMFDLKLSTSFIKQCGNKILDSSILNGFADNT